MKLLDKKLSKTSWGKLLLFVSSMALFYVGSVYAAATGAESGSVGEVAETIMTSFTGVGKLMVAIAYLGGFGFTIAAIFKFKQHKDNPTQIPLGTPIALLVIGIALVFVPGILKMGGATTGLTTAGGFGGAGALEAPGGSDKPSS